MVTLDCRNHGRSDKPEPGQLGIPSDVIELMDLLKIEKAHIHGFSMGGMITGQLLASHPERFITASFGGSGIREADPEWIKKVPPDNENVDHPYEKTFRLWRELNDFTNVILPGKSHLTSIAPAYMPREYPDSLVRFINSNDI